MQRTIPQIPPNAAPRPLPPPAPIPALPHYALARCAHTASALTFLADLLERLPADLRQILTVAELEHELARALARLAQETARRHVTIGEAPPAGDTPFSELVELLYRRLAAAHEARLNADADRELAALM